jgi:hypothetical protein
MKLAYTCSLALMVLASAISGLDTTTLSSPPVTISNQQPDPQLVVQDLFQALNLNFTADQIQEFANQAEGLVVGCFMANQSQLIDPSIRLIY